MTDDPTQAHTEAFWNEAEQQEKYAAEKAERDRLAQELAQARAQRDMAGQAAAHWIGRYYALRGAHGDIPALEVSPRVEGELRALEAAVNPQPQANG